MTNIIKLCEENQTNTRLREDVERRCRLPAGALHERRTVLDSMVRPVLAQFMDEFVGPADPDDARDDYDDSTMSSTIAPALPRTPSWATRRMTTGSSAPTKALAPRAVVRSCSRAHEDGHFCDTNQA